MNSERLQPNIENQSETDVIVNSFRELTPENTNELVFERLEEELRENGFEFANTNEVARVFNNNSLFCRSEEFTKVLELISINKTISLTSDNSANICRMSPDGYRTAMTEGFSGKDVNHTAKTVISFRGDSLTSTNPISRDNDLWRLKPETAEISMAGNGEINSEDVEMISFRFPINFYPTEILTDDEYDRYENAEIKFIVRHYIKKCVPN